MTEEVAKTFTDFILPTSLVTRVDVSRLVREVEWVDNEMTATSVRAKVGAAQQVTPVISGSLEEFLQQNKLTLEDARNRTWLIKELHKLKDNIPTIHMTFAVPADGESLSELAAWLRKSVHPQAVIAVGLQPALVAGVYLRTPNHVHDLSIRAALANSRDVLTQELRALRG